MVLVASLVEHRKKYVPLKNYSSSKYIFFSSSIYVKRMDANQEGMSASHRPNSASVSYWRPGIFKGCGANKAIKSYLLPETSYECEHSPSIM